MKKIISFLFFIALISFFSCAKKGRPSGGPKDETPPVFIIADPPYEKTNFDQDKIELEFNEFVKLKDINKKLVVSPPPKNRPLISPQGSASKYITIKILDTLEPNTTYTFDFGDSVEDNNEGNKLERFKYVFSTGDYIDSLTLKGSVKNSFSDKKVENIKMLLYRIDSSYTDSTIYKRKPNYVASTLDTTLYEFTNLKEGNYRLFALKDAADDYIFDPSRDQLGFYKDVITLPKDSIVTKIIPLFPEELDYKFKTGKEFRKGQLVFGYEGNGEDIKVDVLSEVPDDFKTVTYFEKGKDTLNLWHSPIERDSLIFTVKRDLQIDTVTVKLRKKKLDSLTVQIKSPGYLEFKDTLTFSTNNPIIKVDTTKILFTDIDTLKVPYSIAISKKESKVNLFFDKKFEGNYSIQLNPEAFTDIFNQKNDSLSFYFKTKSLESYGDFSVAVTNPDNINVIVELIGSNNKINERKTIATSGNLSFKYLRPGDYSIRVIYDVNKNGKWDTGSFLEKIQPEKVEYFFKDYEVRANFSYNEIITIKN